MSNRSRHARKKKLRTGPVVIAAVLLAVISLCVFLKPQFGSSDNNTAVVKATAEPVSAASPTPEPTPQVETVTMSFTGDNLIHSGIYKQAAQNAGGNGYDFSSCYANMADFYEEYDLNWINQETLVNNELEPDTYPSFSTPGECAQALYDIGFRVFSLSNNHIYDKGSKGITATRNFWASMPDDVVTTGLWAGEEDYDSIPTNTVNGVNIAYLSYTEHTNGIPTPSSAEANVIYTSELDVMERQIRLAAEQSDVVVVGMHWGVEDSHTTTDAQRELAQKLADWGADIIVGTHPHVLQGAEWFTAEDGRNVFCAYSLGNFISTQKHSDNLVGAVLTLTVEKTINTDGSESIQVESPLFHPIVTHFDSGTVNIATYLFSDYTEDMAKRHGVRNKDSSFSYQKIQDIISANIDPEYLAE